MPEIKAANQEPLLFGTLQLNEICVGCEALTKLLVQKGIISWNELLTVARNTTIEREKVRKELTNSDQ